MSATMTCVAIERATREDDPRTVDREILFEKSNGTLGVQNGIDSQISDSAATLVKRNLSIRRKENAENNVKAESQPAAEAQTHTYSEQSAAQVNGINGVTIKRQSALFLQAVRQKYVLVTDHIVPAVQHDGEILVKVDAVGLNPIDWKAPAFNFGIPSLPWIFGRDLAGVVVQTAPNSRIKKGDLVAVPSTDYRDIRKAAFQEYAIATHYNAVRIPPTTSIHSGVSLGVAFVASALALGICFGLDFDLSKDAPGPNLPQIISQIDQEQIPADVREECFSSADESRRIKRGDWIAIWGASTTTGYVTIQLAKLCGLRVVAVADVARHGAKLHEAGADILVDRLDTNRAVEIIRGVTQGRLRYAIDIVGRDTAAILQQALYIDDSSETSTHLLGLTGLPKERDPRIRYHTVPIKMFHSSPAVGEGLVTWLERLLETQKLVPPEVVVRRDGGLADINDALEVLRSGAVSGKRLVVDLRKNTEIAAN